MKLKKLAALLTAGVLCLGMSTTAFAAISPGDPDQVHGTVEGGGYVWGDNGDKLTGEEKALFDKAEEVLGDKAKLEKELEKLGYDIKDNQSVVVIGMTDYTYYNENGVPAKLPANSKVKFNLSAFEEGRNLQPGNWVTVMHATKLEDGSVVWEVKEGKVFEDENGNLCVEITMDSLSPVAFLKVMQDGSVVRIEKGEVVATTSSTVKASPKTGE